MSEPTRFMSTRSHTENGQQSMCWLRNHNLYLRQHRTPNIRSSGGTDYTHHSDELWLVVMQIMTNERNGKTKKCGSRLETDVIFDVHNVWRWYPVDSGWLCKMLEPREVYQETTG
jgi:hypothetical protein